MMVMSGNNMDGDEAANRGIRRSATPVRGGPAAAGYSLASGPSSGTRRGLR
jgi:hypothetical protein